ncbi:YadA-like family protein [Neisseria leonii]|uniref:YadA-like family protein n=1 Tax=Neisseria leonii TaxID=2995413 RepID=UPI00237BF999|nr:YadA-like family protein [Neisseria sp. 3986]MDD9325952.1 YadA-like family protein [Neisseria sp. 3986]
MWYLVNIYNDVRDQNAFKGTIIEATGNAAYDENTPSKVNVIGTENTANGDVINVVGSNNTAGHNSVVMGFRNTTNRLAVAIGQRNQASADSSSAVGYNNIITNSPDSNGALAYGFNNQINRGVIALGINNQATGKDAVAFGYDSTASAQDAYAIGRNVNVGQTNTFALGRNITTSQANSVVLGNESTDRAATAETGMTVNGKNYTFAGQGSPSKGVLSVGKAGGERQIINVAAGQVSATSTDAVNGSQLYALQQAINNSAGTDKQNYFHTNGTGSAQAGNATNLDAVDGIGGAKGDKAVAAGVSAQATDSHSIAVGTSATASGQSAIAMGREATGTEINASAIGYKANASKNGVALGSETQANAQSVAVGNIAKATGADSIAVGQNAQATGNSAAVLGKNALASGENALALGTTTRGNTTASGQRATAIGSSANSSAQDAIAIGTGSVASGESTVVVGKAAKATGINSLAAGVQSEAYGQNSVSIGTGATAGTSTMTSEDNAQAVAIGRFAKASGFQSTALGADSIASGHSSIAIGADDMDKLVDTQSANNYKNLTGDTITKGDFKKVTSSGGASAAVGTQSKSAGDFAAAFGTRANASGFASTALGVASAASGQAAVALGVASQASAANATAIGNKSKAASANAFAAGSEAAGYGKNSIAIGTGAVAGIRDYRSQTYIGSDSIAVGTAAQATGERAIAIGPNARATGSQSIAVGVGNRVSGKNAGAFGDPNDVRGDGSYSVGNNNAIGETSANAFVMGNQNIIGTEVSYYNGQLDSDNSFSGDRDSSGSISIGSHNRILTPKTLVFGSGIDTVGTGDEIRYLRGTIANSVYLGDDSSANGSGATWDAASGTWINHQVDKGGYRNDRKDVQALGTNTTGGMSKVETGVVSATVNGEQVGDLTFGKFAGHSPQGVVTVGANGMERRIQNVAAGQISATSTDAINGSQLYAVAEVLGAGWELQKDGTKVDNVQPRDIVNFKSSDKSVSIETGLSNDQKTSTLDFKVNVDGTTVTINDQGQLVANGKDTSASVSGSNLIDVQKGSETTVDGATVTNYTVDLSADAKRQLAKEESVSAGDNITVTDNGTNGTGGKDFKVSLNNNVNLTDNGSLQVGGVTINNGGINAGNKPISNVADGTAPTDAVNVKQLNAAKTELENGKNTTVSSRDGANGQKIYKVDAWDTTATGSDAITVTPNNDDNAKTRAYTVDLSTKTKEDIQKGVDAKDKVDNQGITFAGDTGTNVTRKLGETVNVKGNATNAANLTDGNIGVVADGNDTLTVKLNKDVNLGDTGSLTIGGSSLNKDGLNTPKVTANEAKIGPVTINSDGINAGDKTITGVADGVNPTDAVNVKQLKAAKTEVQAGENVTVTPSQGTDGNPVYTVSAKDTSAKVTSATDKLTVANKGTAKEGAADVTNFELDLSQAAKESLAKADTAVQSFTTSVNGQTVETINQGNNDVNFVNGNATTARADGQNITFDVNTDNTTIKVASGQISANTTPLTVTDGKVAPPATTGALATAGDVANAINNSGWKVKVQDMLYPPNFDAGEIINPGDTVSFNTGDRNLSVVREGSNITYSIKRQVDFDNVTLDGGMVRLQHDGDGNLMVGSNKGEPVKITNVFDGENDEDAVNVRQLKGARTVVEAGKNTAVTSTEDPDTFAKTFTVDAWDTKVAAADGAAVTVSSNDNDTDKTRNYTIDLSQATKDQIAKEESVIGEGNITVAENGTNATGGKEYKVTLNNDVDLGDNGSVKIGDTALTKDGLIINDGPILTHDNQGNFKVGKVGDDGTAAPVKITNLEAGTDDNDAVNVSQLNKAVAASKEVVKSDDKSVTVVTTQNADGANVFDLSVNTDNTTITKDPTTGAVKAVTSGITNNDGKATATTSSSLITAGDVANAINESGWKLAAEGTDGTELINPADTVTFKAKDNLNVSRENGNIIYGLNKDVDLTKDGSVKLGDTLLTEDGLMINNGPILTHDNNGNFKVGKVGDDGQAQPVKITNLAEGTDDNDAVNVKQLKAAKTEVADGKNTTVRSEAGTDGQTIYKVDAWDTKVAAGSALTVTPNDNEDAKTREYTVDLSDETKAQIAKEESVDGDSNITVVQDRLNDTNGKNFNVRLNKDVDLTQDGSLKIGDTALTKDGLIINNGPMLVANGNNLKLGSVDGTTVSPIQIQNLDSGLKDTAGNTVDLANASGDVLNNAVNVGDLQKAAAAATTKVQGDQGVTVTPETNTDGSTTYTVAAKTDGTTVKVDDKGNIAAVTSELTNNTDGKVNTPAAANALATAGDIANAINNSGWNLAAEGTDGKELINPADTVTFKAKDNLNVTRDGANITYGLNKDVDLTKDGSLTIGETALTKDGLIINNGPMLVSNGNNLKLGSVNDNGEASPIQIQNVDSGLKDANGNPVELANATGETLNNAVNVGDLKTASQNLVEKGFNIAADNGTDDNVNLGETVKFTDPDGNIVTTVSNNQIQFGLNDQISVGGKDGKDGQIGVNGKDGKDGLTLTPDAIVFNGVDGKDGKDGQVKLQVEKAQPALDGKDGQNGEDGQTRIVYEKPNGEKEEVATLNDGLKFKGDDNQIISKKLNEQLDIIGGADKDSLTDNNIGVNYDNGKLKVQLTKDVDLTKDGSVKLGDTLLTEDGLMINNGPILTHDNNGNFKVGKVGDDGTAAPVKITNLEAGTDDNDAVNVSQLKTEVAASKEEVKSDDKSVTVTTTKNAAGANVYDLSVNTDNTTITKDPTTGEVKAVTSDITTDNDGKSTATTPTSLVTAGDVAEAINASGWKLAAEGTPDSELINPADTVTFKAKDNLNVTRDGANITYGLNKDVDLTQDGSLKIGDTALTKDGLIINNGPMLVSNGNNLKLGSVDGTTVSPIQIQNLDSGLKDTAGNPVELANATGETLNNAVNVGDLKTASQNLVEKGFNITADNSALAGNAKEDNVNLGQTVNFTSTDKNIVTTVADNEIRFALNNNITVGEKGEPGQNGEPGKDGVDGTIGVNGKDGSAVVINGKDGSIGLNGKDGANGLTLKGADGAQGVDGTNGTNGLPGKDGTTRLVYETKDPQDPTKSVTQEVANLNDGLIFTGNNSDTLNRHKLNSVVTIEGEGVDKDAAKTFQSAAGNISVEADGTDKLTVKLNKDIDLTDAGSLKIGETALTKDGLIINNGPMLVANGNNLKLGSVNGTTVSPIQIQNLDSGLKDASGNKVELANASGDVLKNAVNVGDLQKAAAAATTKVQGDQGVTVTPETNTDGSTTYTVAAKTDGTTVKVDDKGNIAAVTSELTNNTDGKVNTPAAANALATAGDIANAINNSGWNLAAEGTDGKELINPADTVTFKAKDNLNVTRDGANITYGLNKDVDLTKDGSLTIGGSKLTKDGLTVGGDNPVTIDGNKGTVGGLTNTTWNPDNIVSGQAATEDQLKQAAAAATTKVVEGDNITVIPTVNADGSTTYKVETKRDVNFDKVSFGPKDAANNPSITNDGNGNLKVGDTNGNAVKITNVADGTAPNDAVNVSQLNTAVAASREEVTSKDGSVKVDDSGRTAGGAKIFDLSVNTDGTTITKGDNGEIKANTTPLTNTDGKVTTPDAADENKLVNAKTVADAINNSGFTLKSSATDGGEKVSGNDELIKSGETVELVAGKNLTVKQEADGKITFATKGDLTADNIQVGEKGEPGKDGVDGTIGVNGKDGSAVVINGKDGSIGLNGKDGANGLTLKGADGAQGVDGTNGVNGLPGKDGTTRLVYETKDPQDPTKSVTQEVANLNDGLIFTGNNSDTLNRHKLNSVVTVKGEGVDKDQSAAFQSAAGNINVKADGNGTLEVQLAKDVKVGSVTADTVTAGNTTVNTDGITIGGSNGAAPVSLTGSGLNNGGNRITNVAPGVADTDAVNVGQLKGLAQGISNRIDEVNADAKAGVAQALATAGLPQAYLPGKSMMAVGGGVYRGATGYAVGYSSISDGGNWIIKGTASGNSRGHFGATAAVGYQW